MAEATDVEIELDPPTVEVADGDPAPEPPKAVTADEGIEALKAKLAEERAGREAAEQREREQAQRVTRAQTDVADSNIKLVTSALERLNEHGAVLESNYAEAAAAGDWVEAAKVQRAMATEAAQALALNSHLQQLKNAPAPRPAPANDPVEALASQLQPASAAWVRAHPQFARDPALYKKMIDAHNWVVNDHPADSPGYFAAVEQMLGVRQAPASRPASREADDNGDVYSAASVAAPPAAPAREGRGAQRPGTIRLNAAQIEAAEMSGLTPKEYAEQLADIERRKTMQ